MKTDRYHYTGCGLDNIYLINGYAIHQTPYGEGVSIENATGLHEVIAKDICLSKGTINGQELRFLRSMLNLSQEAIGEILGVKRVRITQLEGKRINPITPTLDRALRMYYLMHDAGIPEATDLADILRNIDDLEHGFSDFGKTPDGWEKQAA